MSCWEVDFWLGFEELDEAGVALLEDMILAKG